MYVLIKSINYDFPQLKRVMPIYMLESKASGRHCNDIIKTYVKEF